MVVRSRPSFGAAHGSDAGRPVPIRTCIGCRQRAAAAVLLRVVVAPAGDDSVATVPVLAVDLRHRAPGRGAWVHPDLRCVDLAERRRSFARGLGIPAADVRAVRDVVAGIVDTADTGESRSGSLLDRPDQR